VSGFPVPLPISAAALARGRRLAFGGLGGRQRCVSLCRHLTPGQRALIAETLATSQEGRPTTKLALPAPVSLTQAAELFGLKKISVKRARAIMHLDAAVGLTKGIIAGHSAASAAAFNRLGLDIPLASASVVELTRLATAQASRSSRR